MDVIVKQKENGYGCDEIGDERVELPCPIVQMN